MALIHQELFYELMWRAKATQAPYPLPWWVQQYFRKWVEPYDEGLFSSKQAAFGSNAYYRYWNMVGVKDHEQECLVGQAGEIEPVYDTYCVSFFLFDPATRQLFFPQHQAAQLSQYHENDFLPIIHTEYEPNNQVNIHQKIIATVAGARQRSVVMSRFTSNNNSTANPMWLCINVSGIGVTGFNRDDKAGRVSANRMINFMQYLQADGLLEVNTQWGPLFDRPPLQFGLYGNPQNFTDPNFYLANNPYSDLVANGALNNANRATDQVGGLCTACFAWPLQVQGNQPFQLNIILPVDDYRGQQDLAELQSVNYDQLETANRNFWTQKLVNDGCQITLPVNMKWFENLFRICRANLLILADGGQIHPGPTIYDSFWVRDSSVEGIACALAGDGSLTYQQFGTHYLRQFHTTHQQLDDVSLKGFFWSRARNERPRVGL